jgi:hypothetical protein
MRLNPMRAMQSCLGKCCQIPYEVCDAVLDTLTLFPGGNSRADACDARAAAIAPRMAVEGWRFCPCFPEKRTRQHAQIFGLVQTNLANRLACRALTERILDAEKQSAA